MVRKRTQITSPIPFEELQEIFGRVTYRINRVRRRSRTGIRETVIEDRIQLEQAMLNFKSDKATKTLLEHGFAQQIIEEAEVDMADRRRKGSFAWGLGWTRRPMRRLKSGEIKPRGGFPKGYTARVPKKEKKSRR